MKTPSVRVLTALAIFAYVGVTRIDGASGIAGFRDFRAVNPKDTVCQPALDFRVASGVNGFVTGIQGLTSGGSNGSPIQCGTCLRVKNAKTHVSTVVRVVDSAPTADARLELSVDAFASIADLDGRVADVKFKIVPCGELGQPDPSVMRRAKDTKRLPAATNLDTKTPGSGEKTKHKHYSGWPKRRHHKKVERARASLHRYANGHSPSSSAATVA